MAALAVTLVNLRNSMLYPIADKATGGVHIPENAITATDAKKLRKRVAGIVAWVGRTI